MKIIDVPILNDDGSIQAHIKVGPEEAQKFLEFAVNFMIATGHIALVNMAEKNGEIQLSGFNPDKFDA
jgi:hypothetical protein